MAEGAPFVPPGALLHLQARPWVPPLAEGGTCRSDADGKGYSVSSGHSGLESVNPGADLW
jgi:hypothetical protein